MYRLVSCERSGLLVISRHIKLEAARAKLGVLRRKNPVYASNCRILDQNDRDLSDLSDVEKQEIADNAARAFKRYTSS